MQERLVIDLGGKQVEIVHFGFVQTPGDIVVWLPQDKTLWVGNMIQAPPPALPWLLEGRHKDTITTFKKTSRFFTRHSNNHTRTQHAHDQGAN